MNQVSPNFLAHLKSILALPFMAIVVIPSLIYYGIDKKLFNFFDFFSQEVNYGIAAFLLINGVFLFANTVSLFGKKGKGTLAPWDPPKKLVVEGPFRFTRNPMLTGVNFILAGIAFLFSNENILAWMIFFVALNTVYFIFKEEPDLVKRFGNDYLEYKENVPRWIPRLRPWRKGEA